MEDSKRETVTPGVRETVPELSEDEIKDLIARSVEAKEKAYAPYSKFRVGAALLTEKGDVFTGCNVENCAYPLCTCAERCAVAKAVSEGQTSFRAVAVSTDSTDYVSPCGNCRQILSEFVGVSKKNFWVIMTKPGFHQVVSVDELLPHSFTSTDLNSGQQNSPLPNSNL